MRGICAGLAVCAAVVLLIGCGSGQAEEPTRSLVKPEQKSKPEPEDEIWVTLNGRPGAENVGILMAGEREFFADAGLNVGFGVPSYPWRPARYVASGTADIGVVQLPQLVLEREEGKPLVAVGSLLSRSDLALIWLPREGIRDVTDLRGKTIGVSGIPYQREFLRTSLAGAGLDRADIDLERVDYDSVLDLVNGRVDAIVGYGSIEGASLESRGLSPIVMPLRRLGVPVRDELVVVIKGRRAAEDPDVVRRFMAAVRRGTEVALRNPEEAVRVLEKAPERDLGQGRKEIEAEVEATLPLLAKAERMSHQRTRALVAWMHERGLIRRKMPVSTLITNRYLSER